MGKATTNEVSLDGTFLDAVKANTEKCSALLENQKIDTGAEYSRMLTCCSASAVLSPEATRNCGYK
jgi:hypothetical protein